MFGFTRVTPNSDLVAYDNKFCRIGKLTSYGEIRYFLVCMRAWPKHLRLETITEFQVERREQPYFQKRKTVDFSGSMRDPHTSYSLRVFGRYRIGGKTPGLVLKYFAWKTRREMEAWAAGMPEDCQCGEGYED